VAIMAKTIATATQVSPIVGPAGHVASLVTENTTAQTRNRLIRKRLAVPLTTIIATSTLNRTRKPKSAAHDSEIDRPIWYGKFVS
jgi:hypothetical protein